MGCYSHTPVALCLYSGGTLLDQCLLFTYSGGTLCGRPRSRAVGSEELQSKTLLHQCVLFTGGTLLDFMCAIYILRWHSVGTMSAIYILWWHSVGAMCDIYILQW